MWYHNFKDGSLTRFLTTPYGSETTSPYWYPNINGWSYLMAVVQHPYGESDKDKLCALSSVQMPGLGTDKQLVVFTIFAVHGLARLVALGSLGSEPHTCSRQPNKDISIPYKKPKALSASHRQWYPLQASQGTQTTLVTKSSHAQ
jgi:hypothetical protein